RPNPRQLNHDEGSPPMCRHRIAFVIEYELRPQQLVARELLQRHVFLSIAQNDVRHIRKAALFIAAQQKLLVLSQQRSLVVTPAPEPLRLAHPRRMPQRKATKRLLHNGAMTRRRAEAPESSPL